MITNIIGLQLGEEGKGQLALFLNHQDSISVRNDASWHSESCMLPFGILQGFPSGILKNSKVVIGSDYQVDIDKMTEFYYQLPYAHQNTIYVSKSCQVISKQNIEDNKSSAWKTSLGTGNAYAIADKVIRKGKRISQLDSIPEFIKLIDYERFMLEEWKKGKDIIIQNSRGYGLDINLGKFGHTGSQKTTTTYLPFTRPERVIGVFKPYKTKVLTDYLLKGKLAPNKEELARKLNVNPENNIPETDLLEIKDACEINGITDLCITGLDLVVDKDAYIKQVEEITNVKVSFYSYNKVVYERKTCNQDT